VVLGSGITIVTNATAISNSSANLSSTNVLLTYLNSSNVSTAVSIGCSATAGTITCQPSAYLNPNTQYTITVTGLNGKVGGLPAYQSSAPSVITFTTGSSLISFGINATSSDLVTSTNGTTWTPSLMGNDNIINVLTSSYNGIAVTILGGEKSVAVSSNLTFTGSSGVPTYTISKFPSTFETIPDIVIKKWVTDGAGNIVGVGGATGKGIVIYSTNNGASWAELAVGTTPLMTVAWGIPSGGSVVSFVAIDDAGNVRYAVSGALGTWTLVSGAIVDPTDTPIIAYGNGYFVTFNAGSGTPVAYSSPSGVTWTVGGNVTVESVVTSLAYGVVRGTNYWVVGLAPTAAEPGVANYQTADASAAPSTNPWNSSIITGLVGNGSVSTITYGNGIFVLGSSSSVTGQVAYSAGTFNAPTSFTVPGTGSFASGTSVNAIANDGGLNWVAVSSSGTFLYSTLSATTWSAATPTSVPTALAGGALSDVAYLGGGNFATGGVGGKLITSLGSTVSSWSSPKCLPTFPINAVTSGNLTINSTPTPVQIAVGDGGLIAYSINSGVNWTIATSVPAITTNLNAVACGTSSVGGSGICVAVGANGVILTSTNGSIWAAPTGGVPVAASGKILTKVIFAGNSTYGANQFIAAGNAVIVSSTTGSGGANTATGLWTDVTGTWTGANAAFVNGIAFGLNKSVTPNVPTVVLVGGSAASTTGSDGGQVVYSTISASNVLSAFAAPSVSAPSTDNNYTAVAYNNDQFLTVGANSTSNTFGWYSSTGSSWTSLGADPFDSTSVPSSIAASSSLWAVSSAGGTATNSVYTTVDPLGTASFSPSTVTELTAAVNGIIYSSGLGLFILSTQDDGVLTSSTGASAEWTTPSYLTTLQYMINLSSSLGL
jgi:hypothetical protein